MHVVPALEVGGAEVLLRDSLLHYDRSVLAPTVCSMRDKGPIGREIESEGTEVIALGVKGHRIKWSSVFALARIIRERGIDIVHTHLYPANRSGRIAAMLARTPCIIASVHNQYCHRQKPLKRRLLNNLLARGTDAIVAVSEAVKADIVHFDHVAPKKIVVIPNGIDVAAISVGDRAHARLSLGIPQDARVIGSVGRLIDQKGHMYLIEALALIKDTHPKARVLIVGEGPLRGELEALAGSLGVAERVTFAGVRRDIPDMLAAMDAFAMPSLWEGFGIALIEAMVAGVPVVATSIPPFQEIITDREDALIVPIEDAGALASAMELLLDDASLSRKLGEAARTRVISRYGIESTVQSHTKLYESILQGGARG